MIKSFILTTFILLSLNNGCCDIHYQQNPLLQNPNTGETIRNRVLRSYGQYLNDPDYTVHVFNGWHQSPTDPQLHVTIRLYHNGNYIRTRHLH